ncbi:hypothetical protein [Kribbella sp. NPDC048915]|uniref:hypothetical protein n=1 Tax=Kribbella sp. NPDC048915 TaxID=3155148 RepID=UPI0033DD9899
MSSNGAETMTPREHRGPSYQVVLQGDLRPATLAFCAGPAAEHRTAGAFRLRLRDGQDIADLVERLQVAGLTILSIRQLTPAEAALVEPHPQEFVPPELIPRG